jgi:hypothetical protein
MLPELYFRRIFSHKHRVKKYKPIAVKALYFYASDLSDIKYCEYRENIQKYPIIFRLWKNILTTLAINFGEEFPTLGYRFTGFYVLKMSDVRNRTDEWK